MIVALATEVVCHRLVQGVCLPTQDDGSLLAVELQKDYFCPCEGARSILEAQECPHDFVVLHVLEHLGDSPASCAHHLELRLVCKHLILRLGNVSTYWSIQLLCRRARGQRLPRHRWRVLSLEQEQMVQIGLRQ